MKLKKAIAGASLMAAVAGAIWYSQKVRAPVENFDSEPSSQGKERNNVSPVDQVEPAGASMKESKATPPTENPVEPSAADATRSEVQDSNDGADASAADKKAESPKPVIDSVDSREITDPSQIAKSSVGFFAEYPKKISASLIEKEFTGSYSGDLMNSKQKVGHLAISIDGTINQEVFYGDMEISEFDERNIPRSKSRISKDLTYSIREIVENGIKSFLIFSEKTDSESSVYQIKKSGQSIVGNLYKLDATGKLKYDSSFVLRSN